MNVYRILTLALILFSGVAFAQESEPEFEKDTVKLTREQLPPKFQVDTRIDNMGYWRRMAEAGLVPVAPDVMAPPPIQRTSKIMLKGRAGIDSPDVPVTTVNSTQSENSSFADPSGAGTVLNSNNSTPQPSGGGVYGADALLTQDTAATWSGTVQGAGGSNSGDPAATINKDGRWIIGFINNASGQSVAYSDNQGTSWTTKVVATSPSGFNNMLDKNHMWIDNSETSNYNGRLYNAWTTMGGTNDGEIGTSRSTDAGVTWSTPVHISSAANAGSHNQGVNIKTGPNGEVYVIWAVYDSWPADEKAIAIAKSLDGGQTYQPAYRIINNIKGIRNHAVTQNMRVNSFPSAAVDISNGPHRGNIYVVWSNVNTPGVNSGQGVEVYMIKSSDQGVTWSTPLKINSDPLGTNKQHYMPWITCDPSNGNVAIVFYDNRNVSATQTETWCAVSVDGGDSFEDFAVSDVASTPTPISGLATGYMGDYLSITANNSMVYPTWTDTRSGHAMTYVSPFLLTPVMNQAFEAYQEHTLNDGTLGNGNGTPDFGENLLLGLSLKNIGSKPDTSVMVTLSCDSPLVTFSDSTEDFGNFTIGEIKTMADAFAFHISDSVANGAQLVFNVKAVNNLDSTYVSYFSLTANAPQLSVTNIRINDATGNNNQVLDPGETAEITLQYKNISGFDAVNPVSHLNCAQSFVSVANPSVNMASIAPGFSDSATFTVTVAPVTFGSAAQFTNTIGYSFQHTQKSFVESIGLIVEDWETGTFTKFPWTFGGNGNWETDNATVWEGAFAARSKAITHNQTSSLILTYNVMYDDSISFVRKVSSELFHDVLSFYIDNQKLGQFSGNLNWKRVSYPVKAGQHTFKWEYLKDAATSTGQDAAWVDFIVFPPETRTMAYAGNNRSSCAQLPVQMNATATHYASLLWTTSGSGAFSDNTTLDPVYYPSSADVTAGSVVLTLSVTGLSYKESTQSSFVLTFDSPALASAGSDLSVCEGSSVSISGSSAAFYSALNWTGSGNGSFSNPSLLSPEYTPGTSDVASGTVYLYLTAVTGNACPSVTDTLLLSVHPLPQASLSIASEICRGDSTQLNYSLSGTAPFMLEFANGDTRQVPSAVWQEWVKPAASITYTVQHITDAFGCTGNSTASAALTVKPSPVVNLVPDTLLCGNLVLNLASNTQGAVSYLWTPGGATTPTLTVDTAGFGLGTRIFTLAATGANGCVTTAKSGVSFKNCTGIDDQVGNIGFSLYPNPSNGAFAMTFRSPDKQDLSLRVLDAAGNGVYTLNRVTVNGELTRTFDLHQLPQGTYLLVLENNRIQVSRTLIIVR
jgi:hypothetical protein